VCILSSAVSAPDPLCFPPSDVWVVDGPPEPFPRIIALASPPLSCCPSCPGPRFISGSYLVHENFMPAGVVLLAVRAGTANHGNYRAVLLDSSFTRNGPRRARQMAILSDPRPGWPFRSIAGWHFSQPISEHCFILPFCIVSTTISVRTCIATCRVSHTVCSPAEN
jgi:hypothetical protein